MDNVFITVFLFCFSLLPMAYLRYYPFRVIATPREQRILIVGHLIIFAAEFLLVAALFVLGHAAIQENAFQKLYFICYWPHFLLLMFTIRPFWFHHLFVLGLQAIYMVFLHTAAILLLKQIWMQTTYFISLYFLCYLGLVLISFPWMIRLFGKLFVREQLLRKRQTAAFWKYLGFVPLLLAYYQGSMVLRQVQDLSDIHLYMLVSRVILVTIGNWPHPLGAQRLPSGLHHDPREGAQYGDTGAAPRDSRLCRYHAGEAAAARHHAPRQPPPAAHAGRTR